MKEHNLRQEQAIETRQKLLASAKKMLEIMEEKI